MQSRFPCDPLIRIAIIPLKSFRLPTHVVHRMHSIINYVAVWAKSIHPVYTSFAFKPYVSIGNATTAPVSYDQC